MKKCTAIFLQVSLLVSFINVKPVYAEENASVADVVSDNYIVLETNTGEILAEKGAYEKIAPASMTKMLTGIVAIEAISDQKEEIEITSEMLNGLQAQNASVAGLIAGETPTALDLFYCLALPSGADAANALAFTVSGNTESYVEKMNVKAAEIGMKNSHFINTTGLDAEGQYTTCYDMAVLLQYCLQNETFQEVYSTGTYVTSPLLYHNSGLEVHSTFMDYMKSDSGIPGFIGGKTGYTGEAGHCLASWSKINSMDVIVVTAHAMTGSWEKTHLTDTAALLKAFANWDRKTLITAGTPVQSIEVEYAFHKKTITIEAPETVETCLPADAVIRMEHTFPEQETAALSNQNHEGFLIIQADEKPVYSTSILYTVQKEKNLFGRIGLHFSNMTRGCRNETK